MNEKLKVVLFFLLFLSGSGLLFVFQLYLEPRINSKEVAVLLRPVSEHQQIRSDDVALLRRKKDELPDGAFTELSAIVGKHALVDLPAGTVLTKGMIDVHDLRPQEGEVILPINQEQIHAVNASLRAGDWILISFYKSKEKELEGREEETEPPKLERPFRVAAVRSSSGNMVFDTEHGNTNERNTATARIGHLELLVTLDEKMIIEDTLARGFKIWASRVNP